VGLFGSQCRFPLGAKGASELVNEKRFETDCCDFGPTILRSMKQCELEGAYLETALRRSRDLKRGNVVAANQAFDELRNLKNQMRLLPDRGEAMLKRIASHSDVDVRIGASANLLAIDEAFALGVLQTIEKSDRGLASITAKYTIREWRAGKLADYLK
jgi:hypothetical protein